MKLKLIALILVGVLLPLVGACEAIQAPEDQDAPEEQEAPEEE